MSLSTPGQRYNQLIESGKFKPDQHQQPSINSLDRFYQAFTQAKPKKSFFLFATSFPLIHGIYLWGGVGRGKTRLMDLLHDSLGDAMTRRQHYHEFMQEVHQWLQNNGGNKDPLQLLARRLSKNIRVLFLDEFVVTDIADAVILAQLLKGLFGNGISLVTTSNVLPEELYREGIQRASFLPAITLIEKHTEVVCLGGGYDYRKAIMQSSPVYKLSKNHSGDQLLEQEFGRLVESQAVEQQGELLVASRQIRFYKKSVDSIWFRFADLCMGPRHASDYLEIAQCYHTVFIDGVPVLDATQDDCARRFISMIDIFYDHKVKIVISAAAEPDKLYCGERLAFEFQRTASRLNEMQTAQYLSKEHQT